MTNIDNIHNLLIARIIDGNYQPQDLNCFVNLCSSISAAYLKNELYYNRLYFPIINKDDNDLKDISLDLIAPLFERDGSNSFILFKQYLLSNNNQFVEESLLNRLKSIIISKTRQELIERFKVEEPGGYKILRNIKLAPTRSNNIKKFNDQFNTYFYYSDGECQAPLIDNLKAELPEIDQDELLELVHIACKKCKIIPMILECILINVQNDNTYRDFIEITSLFKALKKVLLFKTVPLDSIIQHKGYSNDHNGEDYNSKIFQELDKSIILTVKEKYINTGKIDENVANYYQSVLKEYFNDLIFAHNNNTLPHYLNNGYRKFIKNDNFILHKTRITYLIQICKKRLKQIISEY